MKRIETQGIIGRIDLGYGLTTLFDTGRKVSGLDMAEAVALRAMILRATTEEERMDIFKQITDWTTRIAKTVGVCPVGTAWIMDDGRVAVTEPWFENWEAQ